MIPPGFFIGIDKRFMVTDAPGMFTDEKHATRAINQPEFFNKFTQMGAKKGFVVMSMWGCGGTSVATIKPFKKLADLKGRKIRVLATPLEREVIGSLGATGVPIPYSEVLPSMQRSHDESSGTNHAIDGHVSLKVLELCTVKWVP